MSEPLNKLRGEVPGPPDCARSPQELAEMKKRGIWHPQMDEPQNTPPAKSELAASICSADDAAEYKQLCQLALMTCDDIYNDYTSESINDQPLSIRVAWSWGHKNRQRKLKKQNQGEQP